MGINAYKFCTDEGLQRLKVTNQDIIDRLQAIIDNTKVDLNAINNEIELRDKQKEEKK